MCFIYLSINEGLTMLGTMTRKFTRATFPLGHFTMLIGPDKP